MITDEIAEKKLSDARNARIVNKFFVTSDYIIDLTKITFINMKMKVIQIEGIGIKLNELCPDEWGSFHEAYLKVRKKMQKEFDDGN